MVRQDLATGRDRAGEIKLPELTRTGPGHSCCFIDPGAAKEPNGSRRSALFCRFRGYVGCAGVNKSQRDGLMKAQGGARASEAHPRATLGLRAALNRKPQRGGPNATQRLGRTRGHSCCFKSQRDGLMKAQSGARASEAHPSATLGLRAALNRKPHRGGPNATRRLRGIRFRHDADPNDEGRPMRGYPSLPFPEPRVPRRS